MLASPESGSESVDSLSASWWAWGRLWPWEWEWLCDDPGRGLREAALPPAPEEDDPVMLTRTSPGSVVALMEPSVLGTLGCRSGCSVREVPFPAGVLASADSVCITMGDSLSFSGLRLS